MGIKDNYKLWICYPGIRQDLEELIYEGWIRVVSYSDSKKRKAVETADKKKKAVEPLKRMFFPRDLNDSDVEYSNE